MARNRQRAKQRQEARRAERLARVREDAPETREEALEEIELLTGAPPEDTGRSDTVVEHPPPEPEFEGEDDDLYEPVDEGAALEAPEPAQVSDGGPRGRRGGR